MGRFFLDNEEFEKLLPELVGAEDIQASVYRVQLTYFHERFGAVPHEERVHYPLRLAPVVDHAVRGFLKRYDYKPFLVTRLPSRKGIGAESFYSDGRWLSGDGNYIFNIDERGGEQGLSYEIIAKDEITSQTVMRVFTRMVDRQFKNKVLVVHDEVKILKAAEITALGPEWAEVRETVDPDLADRVEQVVLPFFDRAEEFQKVGIAPKLGLLLHGGTGTGKTYLIKTLIRHFAGKVTVAHLSADQFFSRHGAIRAVFSFLHKYSPLVLVLEDIELLARSRETLIDNPTVQALLDIMDGAVVPLNQVVIIATTNFMDQLDPAFKRPGRFDEVWSFEVPSTEMAQAAFKGYFSPSGLKPPQSLIKACGDSALSYAQLRFVATEVLRRHMSRVTQGNIKVGVAELKEIIKAAQVGMEKRRTVGFQKFGDSFEGYYDDDY